MIFVCIQATQERNICKVHPSCWLFCLGLVFAFAAQDLDYIYNLFSFLRGLNFFFFCLSQHLLYYYICWKRPWTCALVAEFSCFVLVIRVVFLYPTAILKLLRLYAFDRFAGGIKHLFSHAAHELKSKIFITDFQICSSHNLFKGKKCLPLPTIVVCWNCLKLSHMFALYIQFW